MIIDEQFYITPEVGLRLFKTLGPRYPLWCLNARIHLKFFFSSGEPGIEALNIGSAGSSSPVRGFQIQKTQRWYSHVAWRERKRRKSNAEANNIGKSRIRSWDLYSVNE